MTTTGADGVPGEAVPSRTSQAVALARAGLIRPVSAGGDAEAQTRLCAGMRPAPVPTLQAHLIARTRFVDEQVLAAISRGTRQIVILGAGYDDRALRFRAPGVRFFELDHRDTQTDKQRRLEATRFDGSDLTLPPVDFRNRDVADVLLASGHDPRAATLFICEGLLVYLDQATIVGLLAGLRSRAVPDSALAASLAIHADGLDSGQVLTLANAARRSGTTEPWRTILPAGDHLELLHQAGWSVITALDDHDIEPSASSGRSLLVVAQPGRSGPVRNPTEPGDFEQ